MYIPACWIRETWASYFDKEGVSYAFWSAHLETAKFDDQVSSIDKEDSCVDDDLQEKQQENEEDEGLDLLPRAMVRGFVLEDECATMTTNHEASSEVPDQTIDDHSVMETANTLCASPGNYETKATENVAIVTEPPSQTDPVDDATSLPSDHETTQPSDTTEERNSDQTIPMNDTIDDVCLDDNEISHTAVETNVESNITSSPDTADAPVTNPRAKLLTCSELLDLFRSLCLRKVEKKVGEPVVVGMVGYPNVGKSSTINTLIQGKKVPVSATPGRTKHFQVISLCFIGRPVRATITLYPIGRPVRATITLYPIGRPVRATITLYPIPIERPVRATITLSYLLDIVRS